GATGGTCDGFEVGEDLPGDSPRSGGIDLNEVGPYVDGPPAAFVDIDLVRMEFVVSDGVRVGKQCPLVQGGPEAIRCGVRQGPERRFAGTEGHRGGGSSLPALDCVFLRLSTGGDKRLAGLPVRLEFLRERERAGGGR